MNQQKRSTSTKQHSSSSNNTSNSRGGGGGGVGGDDDKYDMPPMSRLFVICSKNHLETELQEEFEKFGPIEEVWCVRNRSNGESKGVAYIKFTKTSNAAKALEELNGKYIGTCTSKPLKVLVASSRAQGSGRHENEQEKYVRLFVIVAKELTEEELSDEFQQYGDLDTVMIIRDKITKENKGFAYIKYHKFSDAALAFENCHPKYKAVFAEPKSAKHSNSDRSDIQRTQRYDDFSMSPLQQQHHIGGNNNRGGSISSGGGGGGGGGSGMGNIGGNNLSGGLNDFAYFGGGGNSRQQGGAASSGGVLAEKQLNIICSKMVNQDQLWRLFDIIPGLDYCQITGECGRNSNYATAVYCSADAAIYARDKLHGLEYPAGERLIIKPLPEFAGGKNHNSHGNNNNNNGFQLMDASNDDFCSVPLPPPHQMADPKSNCAKRLFIVCVPKALPHKILIDVFSRFTGLIDIYMLANKNCGFAKYNDESSAMRAVDILHGAEVCGVTLKVMQAEELREPKRKRFDD